MTAASPHPIEGVQAKAEGHQAKATELTGCLDLRAKHLCIADQFLEPYIGKSRAQLEHPPDGERRHRAGQDAGDGHENPNTGDQRREPIEPRPEPGVRIVELDHSTTNERGRGKKVQNANESIQ